jgi:hypothetical protein
MVVNVQIDVYLLGNICSRVMWSGVSVPLRPGGLVDWLVRVLW